MIELTPYAVLLRKLLDKLGAPLLLVIRDVLQLLGLCRGRLRRQTIRIGPLLLKPSLRLFLLLEPSLGRC